MEEMADLDLGICQKGFLHVDTWSDLPTQNRSRRETEERERDGSNARKLYVLTYHVDYIYFYMHAYVCMYFFFYQTT